MIKPPRLSLRLSTIKNGLSNAYVYMKRLRHLLHDLLHNPDYEYYMAIVLLGVILGTCVSIAIYGLLFY